MPDVVRSRLGVPIRLPDERWAHILEGHEDLMGRRQAVLDTVGNPDAVVAGRAGESLAIREIEPAKWLVVVYEELDGDGFVITAYATSRIASLRTRRQLWP